MWRNSPLANEICMSVRLDLNRRNVHISCRVISSYYMAEMINGEAGKDIGACKLHLGNFTLGPHESLNKPSVGEYAPTATYNKH